MVCIKFDVDNYKKKEKGMSEIIRFWCNYCIVKYSMYNINYVIIEVFVYNFRDKFVNMEV